MSNIDDQNNFNETTRETPPVPPTPDADLSSTVTIPSSPIPPTSDQSLASTLTRTIDLNTNNSNVVAKTSDSEIASHQTFGEDTPKQK